MAEFDQAQSPRLGQRVPIESPGLQILSVNTLPEVAARGTVVWLADKGTVAVYNGTAWWVSGAQNIQTFVQDEEPAADKVGDLWFNTTNSFLYVWNGTIWELIQDAAQEALELEISANHAEAMRLIGQVDDYADGVITTYYDTVAPATPSLGDLWLNEVTNLLYRYNGSTWVEIVDEFVLRAIIEAGRAQATADGKIDTYYNNEPPTGLGQEDDGDLWFDLNDGMRLWRWSGSQWIDVSDARITELANQYSQVLTDLELVNDDLDLIRGQVDQKSTTYFADTAPWPNGTARPDDTGDMWFHSVLKKAYRWDGVSWVLIEDQGITDALEAASNAQGTADGKISHYVAAAPPWANGTTGHSLDIGDIWTDTANYNKRKYWDGDTWEDVSDTRVADLAIQMDAAMGDISDLFAADEAIIGLVDGKISTYFGATSPWANGATGRQADLGDLWFKQPEETVWRWNGASPGTWVQIQDTAIQQALDDAAEAQGTADGKITHYVQGTAPWANGAAGHELDVNDMWTDTANDNLKKYWNGSIWASLPLGGDGVTGDAMDNKTIIGPTIVAGANQYSGERIIIRPDGSGGIIEAYTGMAGETTPGVFNPIVYLSRPAISIKAGATSTYSDQSELILLSSTSGFSASYLFTDYLYLQASNTVNVSNNMSVLGTLGVSGDASFSTNITVGGSINGTMNSGGVGTGTFRDAVDSRVRATAMSGLTSGLSVSNGFDLNGGGSISGGLTLNGGLTMGTNPTISGATTFTSPLTVSNSITASGSSGTVEGVRVYARTPNGTTNAANVRWDSSGGEYKQVTASALKYKENITDAEIDTDALLKIRPRAYDYKKDYAPDAGPQIGLVADELDALGLTAWVVYDEATGEIEDVNYARLTVPLIALVKKQQARLDSLEERLSAAGL